MGYPNILEDIEKVKDKENTILLLDAFDEDLEAIKDHPKRLNEILSKVHKFREIVITCRTQFFPSEKEEPDSIQHLVKFHQKPYLYYIQSS